MRGLGNLSGFILARLCDIFHKVGPREFEDGRPLIFSNTLIFYAGFEFMTTAIKIRRGLQVPVSGSPKQEISEIKEMLAKITSKL